MKKPDLHITINAKVPKNFPQEMPGEKVRNIREFGTSVVAMAAAFSAGGQAIFRDWDAAITDLQMELYRFEAAQNWAAEQSVRAGEVIDLILREIEREERQAQQRAQLILLLAFILLTMLVGLL